MDMKNYNMTYMKKIRKLSNNGLLAEFKYMKLLNVNTKYASSHLFQRNYNTLLFELDRRGLMKK